MSTLTLHTGELLHLREDPLVDKDALLHIRDGALLVEDGIIVASGALASITVPDEAVVVTHRGLIVPGFIDAHVHYPQTDIIGAHGEQLLEWLERYTFPLEAAFADKAVASATAEAFLDELLRNGTTTAAVYATSHPCSADAIFEAAQARGMRLIAGKVLMDAHAPAELLDGPGAGIAESEMLIRRWHGRGRLSYAVTPRFALTSTPEQLEGAGRLLAAHPDVYMQTHLAENLQECGAAMQRHPGAKDYLDVYDRAGLVRERSIFAHAIHLSSGAMARMAGAGAAAAFCPSSNLFLGSGFFDLNAARDAGLNVALGSDVGGGTSFSMLATMGEAYKVCQFRGARFTGADAFYLATLGAARALGLDGRLGNFEPGKEADFVILDLGATPLLQRRMARCQDMNEALFALAVMGDDRAIEATYVAGARAHQRGASMIG